MQNIIFYCLLFIISISATAQTLDKFYIGAFWVGGDSPDTTRQLSPGPVARYNIPPPDPLVPDPSVLPQSRFTELQDLGLNLAAIEFHPEFIIRTVANGQRNVLRDVADDLATNFTTGTSRDIDICAMEYGIHDASELNRIMLHPESGIDFGNRALTTGNYAAHNPFRSFIRSNLNLDRTVLEQQGDINSVRFTSPTNLVNSVTFERKREITARKNFLGDGGTYPTDAANSIAGLYHLSVILADDPDDGDFNPPNDSSPILTVRLISTDSTSIDSTVADTTAREFRDFVILGSDFYDSPLDTEPRSAPFEQYLGRIEIRIDSLRQSNLPGQPEDQRTGYKLVVKDSTSTAEWNLTSPMIARRLRYWEDLVNRGWMHNFDVQLIAHTDAVFLVDAVCLSSPAAFGLFSPGSPHAGAFHGLNAQTMGRLSAIVSDGRGMSLYQTPRLPLLVFKEQSPSGGAFPSTRLIGTALHDSLPACLPYSAHGAEVSTADMQSLLEYHRDKASGFYTYSIDAQYPRMSDGPSPSAYYDSLYVEHSSIPGSRSGRIMQNISRYRQYAANRKSRGVTAPWIPFVQNHSNLFQIDANAVGSPWDWDPLREPNAGELRLMCNIALAHGADGVMFYQYNTHGATLIGADSACWPRLRHQWVADSLRPINRNCGSLGFLGANNLPRVCDANGEDKWDSTKTYIAGFLRPVGELIRDMSWERSFSWNSGAGETQLVNKVISQKQDDPDPIDLSYETYVETAEFNEAGVDYLFVINGRTHAEGHRHITVKLKPDADPSRQWTVENITSGDMWIVKPRNSPDSLTTANGFTDYFPPGSAALYRLVPYQRGSLPFGDTCFEHTLTVTKGASVILTGTKINLAPQGCIVTEDSLSLAGCEVRCCDLEAIANIYVRDGGRLRLGNDGSRPTTVTRVPISVGSGSSINANLAVFSGIWYGTGAINLYDGYARTNHNSVDVRGGGHFIDMYGGELYATGDSVQGNNCCWTVGVQTTGGQVYVEDERFLDLTCGIWAMGGAYVQGCDSAAPRIGRNKIRSYMMGMYCSNSELQFGELPWGQINNWYASQNSIGVTDTASTWHISASSGTVYAHANFWCQGTTPPLQQCTPHNYGNVEATGALTIDPVPFIGDPKTVSSTMQKDLSSSSQSPPGGIRQTVLQHISAGLHTSARAAIEGFLQSGGGLSASVEDLAFLYRNIRRIGAPALVADLLAVCGNRQDLRSKLLAADILKSEGDPASALSILNAYSFVGSSELMRDAFVRKAILYPLSHPGGYNDGLAVLDTLRSLVSMDSTLSWFIEVYPKLFSGLDHAAQSPFPKSRAGDFTSAFQAEGIDVWPNYPNPFSDVTSFTFKLGEDKHVRLAIYDAMGREVDVITDADYQRGVHSAVLRSGDLPNGLYLYRLTTDEGVIQRKMLLMR